MAVKRVAVVLGCVACIGCDDVTARSVVRPDDAASRTVVERLLLLVDAEDEIVEAATLRVDGEVWGTFSATETRTPALVIAERGAGIGERPAMRTVGDWVELLDGSLGPGGHVAELLAFDVRVAGRVERRDVRAVLPFEVLADAETAYVGTFIARPEQAR